MLLSLFLAAFAQDIEPVVGRVSHVEDATVVSPPVCQAARSGGATVSILTERVLAIRGQFASRVSSANNTARCGSSLATIMPGSICTINAGVNICVTTSGELSVDDPQCTLGDRSRETALRTLVAELETCPGVTPERIVGRPSHNN